MWVSRIAALAVLVAAPLLAFAQGRDQAPPNAFQTPSGNVHCLFSGGRMRCDVVEHHYEVPPRPADCRGDWGGRISLAARGPARLECLTRTHRDEDAFVLGYGARWIGPGISCEAQEAGLRCANRQGRGFWVARGVLEMF
ncbi:MAG: hypothetical protein MUC64_18325 [Rubritepida sp.]|nr:hypothetical protein [Rubritepida sp.]